MQDDRTTLQAMVAQSAAARVAANSLHRTLQSRLEPSAALQQHLTTHAAKHKPPAAQPQGAEHPAQGADGDDNDDEDDDEDE